MLASLLYSFAGARRRLASIARIWCCAPLVFAMLVLFAGAGAPSAHAATNVVTNLNDSGPGSLRQTIAEAASGSTITFSVSGTIDLNGELVVSKDLTINGPGAASLIISGNRINPILAS